MVEEGRRRRLEEALQPPAVSSSCSPLSLTPSSSSLTHFKWKEAERARERFWLELRATRNRVTVEEEQHDLDRIRYHGNQTLQKIRNFSFPTERGCQVEHLMHHLQGKKRGDKQHTLKMDFVLKSSSWTAAGYIPEHAANALIRISRAVDVGHQRHVSRFLEGTLHPDFCYHGQGIPAFCWIAVMEQLQSFAVEDRRANLSHFWKQLYTDLQSASDTWAPLTTEVERLLKDVDELEGAYPLIYSRRTRVHATGRMVSLRTGVTSPLSLASAHALFEDDHFQCKYHALRKYSCWVSRLQAAYSNMKELLSEARSKWSSSPDLNGMLHRVQLTDVTTCIVGSCTQAPVDVTNDGDVSTYTKDNLSGRRGRTDSHRSQPRGRSSSWGLLDMLSNIKADCDDTCGADLTYSSMFEKMGLPQLHPSYLFSELIENQTEENPDGDDESICHETLVSKIACLPLQILAEIVKSRLLTGIYEKKDVKIQNQEEKNRLDSLLKISKDEPILKSSQSSTNMFLDCTNLFTIARQYQRALSEHMVTHSVDLQDRLFPEEESVKDKQLSERLLYLFELGYVFCLQSSLENFSRGLQSEDGDAIHSIVGGTRAVRDSLRRFHRECVMWPREAARVIGSWRAGLRAAIMQCQMASVLMKQCCLLLKRCSNELIATETTSTPSKSPVALNFSSPCSDESTDRHLLIKSKSLSERSSGTTPLSDAMQDSDLAPMLDFSSALHAVLEVCSDSVKRAAAAIADVFLSRQYVVRDTEALIDYLIGSDYTLINFSDDTGVQRDLMVPGCRVLFSPALVNSVRYDDERFNVQYVHKFLTQSIGDNDAFDGHAIIFNLAQSTRKKAAEARKVEQAGKTFEEIWEEKGGETVALELEDEDFEIPENGIFQTFDAARQSSFRLLAGNYRQLQREIKTFEQTLGGSKSEQVVKLERVKGTNILGGPINTFSALNECICGDEDKSLQDDLKELNTLCSNLLSSWFPIFEDVRSLTCARGQDLKASVAKSCCRCIALSITLMSFQVEKDEKDWQSLQLATRWAQVAKDVLLLANSEQSRYLVTRIYPNLTPQLCNCSKFLHSLLIKLVDKVDDETFKDCFELLSDIISFQHKSSHRPEVNKTNKSNRMHGSPVNKQLKFRSNDEHRAGSGGGEEDDEGEEEPEDEDNDDEDGADVSPRSSYLQRCSSSTFGHAEAGERRSGKLLGTVVNVEEEDKKIISNPGENPRSWIRGERIGHAKFVGFFQESSGDAEDCIYKGHYCDTHEMIAVRRRKLKKRLTWNVLREKVHRLHLLSKESHPHILNYHGVVPCGQDSVYILIEFCPEGSLSTHMHSLLQGNTRLRMSHFRKEKLWKQSFPASQGRAGIVLIEPMTVKLYVAQILNALYFLHEEKRLFLCNLEASSVLLSGNGQSIKLANLEYFLTYEEANETRDFGDTYGTLLLNYLDVNGVAAARTLDMWGLGAIVFECMYGERLKLFSSPDQDEEETMSELKEIVLDPLEEASDGRDESLVDLARKFWKACFQPSDRPIEVLCEHAFLEGMGLNNTRS